MSDTPGRQTYELENTWFESVRRAASTDLLEKIDALSGSDMPWAHLLSLALETPPPRDVPNFLAHVEATDADEVRLRLLGYYVRYVRRLTPPEVIAAAAVGDRDAQQEFLRTSTPGDDGWQQVLRALLPLDSVETKARVLAILRGWYEQVFHGQEAEAMPIIERDAERLRAMARTLQPARVLAAALTGYEYVPEWDIRRVALIPSLVIRPHIHTLDHADTKIIAYSVADESLAAETDTPSPRLLRLAKALGDERRLRILKRLTAGDRTLHELAVDFDVSDTTMLHHLIILRAAGLVRVRSQAGKRYHLERHVLPEAGMLLEKYLGPAAEVDASS
jgi:DNA-binding transcriptional ArsR family regulator